jgi:sodium-dependent phosphate cotransporter
MLLLFLFSLDLMVSSLQHLGRNAAETVIMATANPFTGLFIGLLVTAMIQSSSTTTSMVVALVASGSITLQSAVPIIMGANVGTTITSTIVSLGFINKRKEFRRAVAAGTYHDFFNILTVVILFPLEYYYGFMSGVSEKIAHYFFTPVIGPVENKISHFWSGFTPIIEFLATHISNGFILAVLSFALLFTSILLFRKLISNLLLVNSPERFSRFFFKNEFKSFLWGLGITAAIRSSTITTSLVVPIVAKKIVSLKKAAPFIIGANIGTTVTAFIAVTLNSNTTGAISIAIAHFLFNFIGFLIFFPIPFLRKIPIKLASELGRLTLKYRLVGLVYILMTFFFIPFSLIYLNQDSFTVLEITYEKTDTTAVKSVYRIVSKMNERNQSGEWLQYPSASEKLNEAPEIIYPVSLKNNILFARQQMFLFNKPGFCWDGENAEGKFKCCVDEILPQFALDDTLTFDSVYVYTRTYYRSPEEDPLNVTIFISAPYCIILKRETRSKNDAVIATEKIIRFSEK